MKKNININNKKAGFKFEFLEKYTAGMILVGSEIKSIRNMDANFNDSYCFFIGEELFLKSFHIAEYKFAATFNHDPLRDRKLLLNKSELTHLRSKVSEKGLSIVPVRLYIDERGLAKMEIALARGMKAPDKKQKIKEQDIARDMDREIKEY